MAVETSAGVSSGAIGGPSAYNRAILTNDGSGGEIIGSPSNGSIIVIDQINVYCDGTVTDQESWLSLQPYHPVLFVFQESDDLKSTWQLFGPIVMIPGDNLFSHVLTGTWDWNVVYRVYPQILPPA